MKTSSPCKHEFSLSEREKEIIDLFCEGLTYKEVGERLFISENTVDYHRKNISSKFGIYGSGRFTKWLIDYKTKEIRAQRDQCFKASNTSGTL